MTCEAPCNVIVAKKKKYTSKEAYEKCFGGRGQQGCPLMAIQEIVLKECRGRCIAVWGVVSVGRVQDLPERNTAEDEGAVEAPEGKRSVEVMWLRRGEEGEEGEQMMPEDQRSSVSGMEAVSERRARTRSMALFSARRHSFTLRKLWT